MCVVTDNLVKRGAHIGLSVSNRPVKNNVYWGYNTVRDCVQWGAQLQGESGGIAHHYFYHCVFENTVRGDAKARYPQDSGHGFRTNGACRGLVFEDCVFRDNGGYGVQLGGSGRRSPWTSSARRSPATDRPPSAGPRSTRRWSSATARSRATRTTGCRRPSPSPARRRLPTSVVPESIRAGEPVAVPMQLARGGRHRRAALGLRRRHSGSDGPSRSTRSPSPASTG